MTTSYIKAVDTEKKKVACYICGRETPTIVVYDDNDIKIVKCRKCGLMYQNPRLSVAGITEETDKESYYKIYNKIAEDQEKFFKYRFKTILKDMVPGKVIDVGCGIGIFLKIAKELGWDIYGVEPSLVASQIASKKLNISMIKGNIEESNYERDFFDLVNMSHVLEHLSDPLKTLKEIRRIMKPSGYLLIEVPNENNFKIRNFLLNLAIASSTEEKFAPKNYHLSLFTKKTLASLIKKAGFKLLLIKEEGFGVPGREDWILKSLNPFVRTFAFLAKNLQLDVRIGLGHYLIALAKKE